MAEWLYEDGIGEERAALVENGVILEARIEPEEFSVKAGAIHEAKLDSILPDGRTGRLRLDTKEEALIEPLPDGITEGGALFVEIVRAAIPELGRPKLAKGRHAPTTRERKAAPRLRDHLEATGIAIRKIAPHEHDLLEDVGWSELFEQAASGDVPFAKGGLRIAPTPAMTTIDVDGFLPPAALAIAGARAAGKAIRQFGIAGSIVIDLPSVDEKAVRRAAAEALDEVLPKPFERTSVNGFGLLQVVRKKTGPSFFERVHFDLVTAQARLLLRKAMRTAGSGPRSLSAHPAILARIEDNPGWIAALSRSVGAEIKLTPDKSLGLFGGHANAAHPG